jgi:hypothetical protein
MPRWNESGVALRKRATRSTGVLPLVAAITSAVALTGAAFYTVEQAGCGSPGQYIRHDDHIELVGGCVDGSELPGANLPQQHGPQAPITAEHQNYRP